MSRLDTALRLLKSGKPIIPISRATKKPLVEWKPYQDQLPTEEQAKSWWKQWPDANIGMITGHLSGLIVIDCDSAVATKRFEDSCPEARDTLQAQTGRDGARHFYFVHEEGIRNDAGKLLGEGIDVRGEGGFVIVPGSVHANGKTYRWLK